MELKNFNLGSVSISNLQLIVICCSIVLMIILNIIVNYTKTGKAMRAVSYDTGAASLMGISVNKTIASNITKTIDIIIIFFFLLIHQNSYFKYYTKYFIFLKTK
jgi:ABC-type glucose/galactose transport system permease subunit